MIKEICFANEIIIFARYTLMNKEDIMLAYTYIEHGKFELQEKARPEIKDSRDAIVRVTLGSICTSDLHIKHGSVPRAVPGITDRKSTRLNSSHIQKSRMPSSA